MHPFHKKKVSSAAGPHTPFLAEKRRWEPRFPRRQTRLAPGTPQHSGVSHAPNNQIEAFPERGEFFQGWGRGKRERKRTEFLVEIGEPRRGEPQSQGSPRGPVSMQSPDDTPGSPTHWLHGAASPRRCVSPREGAPPHFVAGSECHKNLCEL